jgi:hypothetical protein
MTGLDGEIQQITNELAIQRDKRYIRWSGNAEEIAGELRSLIRRENVRGYEIGTKELFGPKIA